MNKIIASLALIAAFVLAGLLAGGARQAAVAYPGGDTIVAAAASDTTDEEIEGDTIGDEVDDTHWG